jgi:hypothetical protein
MKGDSETEFCVFFIATMLDNKLYDFQGEQQYLSLIYMSPPRTSAIKTSLTLNYSTKKKQQKKNEGKVKGRCILLRKHTIASAAQSFRAFILSQNPPHK